MDRARRVYADDATRLCARHLVDSLKAAGVDMLKMYDLSKDMYFVVAAAARRVGIPFGGHAAAESPLDASDSGASITDHLYAPADNLWTSRCFGAGVSVEQCQPVAERFRHNGTWWVPTLVIEGHGGGGTYTQSSITHLIELARVFWTGTLPHGNWLRDSANSGTPAHHTPTHWAPCMSFSVLGCRSWPVQTLERPL
jgi:hypothetical protein